ncbi:DNA topoisomerase 1-like [Dendrobium catenatum]|uniref:Uncharacterized protein n=1 Tax=Dendrobium catenatum TaxID=906689 RepID=A0A2I0WIF5_9ASPA|nr:DNA topoisomerase 1-like [Dendrobium catenatum]PKU75429.1 hypothetical protein MA16_Dca026158 [Dendrobium catenatum]
MSRCYPFPPPGYEPKTRTGIIDLSTKEKHVEKKHKKEKRDKEKRGHKEKRNKTDRIKDKHKENKDQKHKDRKNEKDRDICRTSQDRKAEGLSQGHNELHIKESLQKTEEELGKRTKYDGAENPMVGSFANSIQRKFKGAAGTANASLGNERVAASQAFSVQVGSVQRRNDRSDPPIENFAISLQKEAEYIRTEENIVENAEAIVANKFRNYGKKDQVDTLNCKPLAPHKDNAIGTECVDGTMKKRKNLDTNGYIKENDERPGKIPRLWELHLTAPSSISLRPDRLLENKERLINGNAISKYLSQIYAVPKMVELPKLDDQEWLFNLHDSLQKSKTELKAEKIPQVFAEAMRIDSADVLALPYVVPF